MPSSNLSDQTIASCALNSIDEWNNIRANSTTYYASSEGDDRSYMDSHVAEITHHLG